MSGFKVEILAIGAHPDDVECSASGTLVKHIQKGGRAAIVDLTKGELGTYGSPQLRYQEAVKAAALMKLSFREQLDLPDGNIVNDETARMKVIQMIRRYQPEIILANAFEDRHPDHGKAAVLVEEAAFLSGLKNIETAIGGYKQEPWRPRVVYHYSQGYYTVPDVVIDVTEVYPQKVAVLKAYESQFVIPYQGRDGLIEYIEAVDSVFGRAIHAKYGEGFTCKRAVGAKQITDLV